MIFYSMVAFLVLFKDINKTVNSLSILVSILCLLFALTGYYAKGFRLSGFKPHRFAKLLAIYSLTLGTSLIIVGLIHSISQMETKSFSESLIIFLFLSLPMVIAAIAILFSKAIKQKVLILSTLQHPYPRALANNQKNSINWIVKAKHWEIFLLICPFEIMAIIDFQGGIEHLYWINLIGFTVVQLWQFFLTNELIKMVPKVYGLKTNLYYFNVLLFFISYLTAIYMFNGKGFNVKGVYALIGFYVFYASLQSFGFAARIIKSKELNRKSKKRESIGYFFLFLFLPIGIWILQPKINKLYNIQSE
jgi:hypothetical protein